MCYVRYNNLNFDKIVASELADRDTCFFFNLYSIRFYMFAHDDNPLSVEHYTILKRHIMFYNKIYFLSKTIVVTVLLLVY